MLVLALTLAIIVTSSEACGVCKRHALDSDASLPEKAHRHHVKKQISPYLPYQQSQETTQKPYRAPSRTYQQQQQQQQDYPAQQVYHALKPSDTYQVTKSPVATNPGQQQAPSSYQTPSPVPPKPAYTSQPDNSYQPQPPQQISYQPQPPQQNSYQRQQNYNPTPVKPQQATLYPVYPAASNPAPPLPQYNQQTAALPVYNAPARPCQKCNQEKIKANGENPAISYEPVFQANQDYPCNGLSNAELLALVNGEPVGYVRHKLREGDEVPIGFIRIEGCNSEKCKKWRDRSDSSSSSSSECD